MPQMIMMCRELLKIDLGSNFLSLATTAQNYFFIFIKFHDFDKNKKVKIILKKSIIARMLLLMKKILNVEKTMAHYSSSLHRESKLGNQLLFMGCIHYQRK